MQNAKYVCKVYFTSDNIYVQGHICCFLNLNEVMSGTKIEAFDVSNQDYDYTF